MVVVIATALAETLAKHMFTKFFNNNGGVDIDGAPSWYMVEMDDDLCTFAHSKGGFDSIDIAKKESKIKMVKKIGQIIEIVIYDNTKNIKNVKEKQIVEKWKVDSKLPIFVNKHLNYSRVAYEDDVDTTFVRSCIPRQIIFDYQKDRLMGIKAFVLSEKTNMAHDELDKSFEDDDDFADKSKDKFNF